MNQLVEATMHFSSGVINAVAELVHDWAHKTVNHKLMTQHMQGCIKLFSYFSSMNSYRFAPYTSSNKYLGWIADTFCT